jgi:hypothetical protein
MEIFALMLIAVAGIIRGFIAFNRRSKLSMRLRMIITTLSITFVATAYLIIAMNYASNWVSHTLLTFGEWFHPPLFIELIVDLFTGIIAGSALSLGSHLLRDDNPRRKTIIGLILIAVSSLLLLALGFGPLFIFFMRVTG